MLFVFLIGREKRDDVKIMEVMAGKKNELREILTGIGPFGDIKGDT